MCFLNIPCVCLFVFVASFEDRHSQSCVRVCTLYPYKRRTVLTYVHTVHAVCVMYCAVYIHSLKERNEGRKEGAFKTVGEKKEEERGEMSS